MTAFDCPFVACKCCATSFGQVFPSFVAVLAAMIRLFRARVPILSPSEERSNCNQRDSSEEGALLAKGNSLVQQQQQQQLLRNGILLGREKGETVTEVFKLSVSQFQECLKRLPLSF